LAGGVDNQCGERLQEITAESATERAGYRMTERSETVLLRHGRDRVTADNAGDDLDDEVAERPGHRAAFLVRLLDGVAGGPHAPSGAPLKRPHNSGRPSQQSVTRKAINA